MALLHWIRDKIAPRGEAYRRMRFGLGKGATALIDFRWDSAFYFGTYENELDEYFRLLVKKGTRCFDVGGYRGWDALCFAQLSRTATVTFEPNLQNVDYMRRSLSRAAAPVTIVETLIGDRIENGMTTLDQACRDYFLPDLVKIDIEGAETDALRGAGDLLSSRKPSFVIEVHSPACESDCLEILRHHGYSPLVVERKKKLLGERRSISHNRWIVSAGADIAPEITSSLLAIGR